MTTNNNNALIAALEANTAAQKENSEKLGSLYGLLTDIQPKLGFNLAALDKLEVAITDLAGSLPRG